MKRLLIILVAFAFVFGAISIAAACEKDGAKKSEPCNKDAEKSASKPTVFDKAQPAGTKAVCPVSGHSFEITKDTLHSEVDGKFVYYCCAGCKDKFDADPAKYLSK